jgi:hypothetical protein
MYIQKNVPRSTRLVWFFNFLRHIPTSQNTGMMDHYLGFIYLPVVCTVISLVNLFWIRRYKIWSIDQQQIWFHLYNLDHWCTFVVVESIWCFQKRVGALLYILNVDNNPICISNHIMVSTSWQSVCKYQCTRTHDFWDLTNTNGHPLIIILSQSAHTYYNFLF